jgi:tRNA nucleotidyltransferase/poly(A) polymerase
LPPIDDHERMALSDAPRAPRASSLEAATEAVRRLREAGFEAWFAGGCVRDRLLGREALDHDVATNAVPDEVQKVFRRTVAVGKQFGVIVALIRGREVEVATFRADDAYSDGRHPDRVTFSDLETDVRRRDFTINGMMENPLTGDIVDLVGGRADLAARVIRAIGDPEKRFDEDRLRMLRAVRFAAQLGFVIEPATLGAVKRRAGELSSVSRERVREELEKTLKSAGAADGARLLRDTGLLGPAVPAAAALSGADWDATVAVIAALARREVPLSFAALLHRTAGVEESCRDLRLSNADRESVRWLVAKLPAAACAGSLPPRDWKPLLAHDGAADLLELHRAIQVAAKAPLDSWTILSSRIGAPDNDPPRLISGDELLAMGIPKGREVGRILQAVRDAQLDGEIGTADEARSLARRLTTG